MYFTIFSIFKSLFSFLLPENSVEIYGFTLITFTRDVPKLSFVIFFTLKFYCQKHTHTHKNPLLYELAPCNVPTPCNVSTPFRHSRR